METTELELVKFNITDAAIGELKAKYLPLTISGLEDKEGYKAVHEARMIIKGKRVEVGKRKKELNEDALKYQRSVNAEAERITALLSPIETHLEKEEARIDQLKEQARIEKEKLEQQKLQERVQLLIKNGCAFDGSNYTIGDLLINSLDIKVWTPEKFEAFIQAVVMQNEKELAEKAAIEARITAEKLEQERQAKEAQDKLIAERKELERLRQEQADREANMKAEQDRIASEQKAREDKIKADQAAIEKQQRDIENARIQKEAEEKRQIELKAAAERAAEAEKKRLDAEAKDRQWRGRLDLLSTLAFGWNGQAAFAEEGWTSQEVSYDQLTSLTDKDFSAVFSKLQKDYNVHVEEVKEETRLVIAKAQKEKEVREASLRPDKEKLQAFAADIINIKYPDLSDEAAKEILSDVTGLLKKASNFIINRLGAL